jgi:S1-C subfamily serine protease
MKRPTRKRPFGLQLVQQTDDPASGSPGRGVAAPPNDAELLDSYSQAVIGVVDAVGPAVVGLTASGSASDRSRASGSGVVVTPDGYVLTNQHVVANIGSTSVSFADGTTVDADLVGEDVATDLAVLRARASGLPWATLGESNELRPGQLVIALGNPLGFQSTVSSGVVSAVGRSLRARDGRLIEGIVQHTAPLNPGSSGGPLLNSVGHVVGINTAIIAMAQGIGFSVPSNTAHWVLSQLLQHGRVRRAALGVAARERAIDSRLARHLGLHPARAVEVMGYDADGPGAKSGLRRGDLIVAIAGHRVVSVDDLHRFLADWPIGAEVEIEVVRGKTRLSLTAVPREAA